MLLFFVFTFVAMLILLYFSFFSTYVLMIEIVLGTVPLFFAFMETIMGLVAFIKFKKE